MTKGRTTTFSHLRRFFVCIDSEVNVQKPRAIVSFECDEEIETILEELKKNLHLNRSNSIRHCIRVAGGTHRASAQSRFPLVAVVNAKPDPKDRL